ncbi:MAG: hypothetical protein KME20_13825 [Kaiparowitsia implicata GSE-PSE-MK54-09C]|nr:hypothetical protein [Kaiparowitsia implicata GSE-PSE-MK54-09C]
MNGTTQTTSKQTEIPAQTIQNTEEFNQWALAVRQQMIASLRKRGVRY